MFAANVKLCHVAYVTNLLSRSKGKPYNMGGDFYENEARLCESDLDCTNEELYSSDFLVDEVSYNTSSHLHTGCLTTQEDHHCDLGNY